MTIAVIKTGGKQYLVSEGKVLKIEKIQGEKGDNITFDNVLMVGDDKSGEVEVGTPTVSGQVVEAKIMEQGRNRKVVVTKYKAKIRYHKDYGHRQHFTQVKITKIGKGTAKKAAPAKKPVAKKTSK